MDSIADRMAWRRLPALNSSFLGKDLKHYYTSRRQPDQKYHSTTLASLVFTTK
ncbi:hypothetical protein J6590_064968 [Homalodisca vitripennis]|nr:hypothetical protein J6590_064968 [Homalodisca vitripennis]